MWLQVIQKPKTEYWEISEDLPELTIKINTNTGVRSIPYKRTILSEIDRHYSVSDRQTVWKKIAINSEELGWALQTWRKYPLPIILRRTLAPSEMEHCNQLVRTEIRKQAEIEQPQDIAHIATRAREQKYPNVYLRQLRSTNFEYFILTRDHEVIAKLPCLDLLSSYDGIEGTYAPVTGISRRFRNVYKFLLSKGRDNWLLLDRDEDIWVLNIEVPRRFHIHLTDNLLSKE